MNSTDFDLQIRKQVGEEIRNQRIRLRYSRAKIAEKLHVSSQLVYYMERGERSVSDSYREKLNRLQREYQMKERVSIEEPCPPVVKSMHSHLLNHEDSMAQQLGEYFLKRMDQKDPDWIRIAHLTAIAYSLEYNSLNLKDSSSSRGLELASRSRELTLSAFKGLKDSKQDTWLRHAITNEMLGYRFSELDPSDVDGCKDIFHQVRRLFDEDPKVAYLWNALEVLCRCKSLESEIPALLEKLYEAAKSHSSVNRRIESEDRYLLSRKYIWW